MESRADATAASQSRGLSQEWPSTVDDAGVIAGTQVRRLADVAALRADFQAAYVSTRAVRRGKKKAGQDEEVSPELDAFVNAATRPFKCYRAPIMAYFGNDQIGKFVLALWVRIMADCLL